VSCKQWKVIGSDADDNSMQGTALAQMRSRWVAECKRGRVDVGNTVIASTAIKREVISDSIA
jgi:UDP-N-acetylmuramate-alanine ligase